MKLRTVSAVRRWLKSVEWSDEASRDKAGDADAVLRVCPDPLTGSLEEICIDGPDMRPEAVAAGNTGWPDGYWGVSDGNHGYIAYFMHESDARGFREWLIASILYGRTTAERYPDERYLMRGYRIGNARP